MPTKPILHDEGLDLIFREARSHSAWDSRPVSDVILQAVYDLARMGPTSANCSPMRVVFVKSPEGKARLKPHLDALNVDKTMSAPVTAIIAQDTRFYDLLPELFPYTDARSWFAGNPTLAESTMFRNASLQGAYLMIAARALGLDCGPMSGFNAEGINREFFADGRLQVNFLCNLGHGDPSKLYPRSPRLDFDRACSII